MQPSPSPFDQRKAHILSKLFHPDKSPKGSVDTAIIPLLNLFNGHPDYITTSSCSGRISIFHQCNDDDGEVCDSIAPKERWVFVTHDSVNHVEEVTHTIFSKLIDKEFYKKELGAKQLIIFRFEPFILHVEARNMSAAHALVSTCTQAGLRLSGVFLLFFYLLLSFPLFLQPFSSSLLSSHCFSLLTIFSIFCSIQFPFTLCTH
jgi:tRNA wybutosine-synthesizing protein 3